ncbi:hypothetical protein EVAR_23479_1 [Eumeta japonica]|uniref:Uncharacterized protein n=1 Tax=Eumeta variegata TaxID=151549 RepID=A0A4C1UJV5_EUMVA|nr:hypothetical protein EVAR_23479_1 [Eumeta japonica]
MKRGVGHRSSYSQTDCNNGSYYFTSAFWETVTSHRSSAAGKLTTTRLHRSDQHITKIRHVHQGVRSVKTTSRCARARDVQSCDE